MYNLSDYRVAIRKIKGEIEYPKFPYSKPSNYPELYQNNEDPDPTNSVYGTLRMLFYDLGLDIPNYQTKIWNPLGVFIKPGDTVVIKPNWVTHHNQSGGGTDELITHTSLIKTILDYILIALRYKGKIIIADAPIQGCDFQTLLKITRVKDLIEIYRDRFPEIELQILDLRKTTLSGVTQFSQKGDPAGYSKIDLNKESLLTDLDDHVKKFRVSQYDHNLLLRHHNHSKHEYLISNSVLNADLVISISKLKTHQKAGLTAALKNIIGINGHKEYLPHYIQGSSLGGGDQYIHPNRLKEIHDKLSDQYWQRGYSRDTLTGRTTHFFMKCLRVLNFLFFRDTLFDGGWYGNKTIPRVIIDLNNLLYYYDLGARTFSKFPRRKVFHIVDGIIGGEGEGPLAPKSKKAGLVIAGFNPLAIDYVLAKIIGYNPAKIKTIFFGYNHQKSLLVSFKNSFISNIKVKYNGDGLELDKIPKIIFRKPKYWYDKEI